MTLSELNKITAEYEEQKQNVYRAYMDDLCAETAKWIKENDYFLLLG